MDKRPELQQSACCNHVNGALMLFDHRLVPALLLTILAPAAPAFAGQCEDSFDRQAKILGDTRFSAQVELPGLTADSAFAQLRSILPNYGVRIVHEDPYSGQMNAESIESMAAKGHPVDIFYSNAAGRGQVQISYTRKTNLLKKKTGVQDQLCGILNQLVVRDIPAANGRACQARSMSIRSASANKSWPAPTIQRGYAPCLRAAIIASRAG
jgi:hypothetical protein